MSFKTKTIVFTCFEEQAVKDPESWLKNLSTKCSWVMGQLEKCPETQKIHIQGMAFSKDTIRWGFLNGTKSWKQICKDPIKSIEYVSKNESKLDGPWEFGVRPTWNIKGRRAINNTEILNTPLPQLVEENKINIRDYEKIRRSINLYKLDKNTMDREPEENLWIVGKPGIGKSYWVRENFKSLFIKPQNKWWDGYNGEEVVHLEDLDMQGKCLSHYLKIWGDRYNLTGETKGGTIRPSYNRFIITSNYTPDELWGGQFGDPILVDAITRRFTVREMVTRGKFD